MGIALDKRVAITDGTWRRIVGIVRDVRNDGLEAPAKPTIYIPFSQYPRASISLIVRSDTNSPTVMIGLRDAVRDIDRLQPLFGMQTMQQVLGESLSLRRFLMLLIGIFAGIALMLGLVGGTESSHTWSASGGKSLRFASRWAPRSQRSYGSSPGAACSWRP